MKQRNNSFFICVLLAQFFPLLPSNEFHQISHNRPCAEINFDHYQDMRQSNNVNISLNVTQVPQNNSYMCRANYSAVDCYASKELMYYFATVITSAMHNAAIEDHRYAIPGYVSPHGLRDCIKQLSQFFGCNAGIIEHVQMRLYSYCERIENVVFDAQGLFRDQLGRREQIALVNIYADFLKEFYAQGAKYLFGDQSKKNLLMQEAVSRIDWQLYDGRDYTSSSKTIDKRNAGSVNGNLGAVYKALKAGDSEQAYALGQQRVHIKVPGKIWGKTESITSVFEKYPDLQKIVEQKYLADKAKIEQQRIAQQTAMQEKVSVLHCEYKMYSSAEKVPLPSDALLQRYQAADRDGIVTFNKKMHNVSSDISGHIHSECLTADKKGILFDGCHLQHQLVDEAISVIDTAISCDLVENIQDAVVDLANASLLSNKGGDILTASHTLDACWAIIDFGKKAVGYAYRTATTYAPLIAQGVYEGIGESLHGAAHVVCHPVETAQAFVNAGYYLGKLTYSIALHDATCDMMQLNPEHVEQEIREHSGDPTVFFAAYEMAKNVSTQDIARVGAKTVVDMMLLHGATKVVSAIAKEALPVFLSCMRKGAQSADVAITAEGIPVRCAEEVNFLMNNVEKVGGVTESGIKLEKRILSATEKIGCVEIKNPVLDNIRTGSALKKDSHHAFNDIIDNYAGIAKEFDLIGDDKVVRKLYQLEGVLDGKEGLFEWIVDPDSIKGVTHRLFIKGIRPTGRPNAW